MKTASFEKLGEILKPSLEPKLTLFQSREPISVDQQVAIALYELASCSEYRVVDNVHIWYINLR